MPDYFEAPCLDVLEAELNKAHPNRDKRSDGWIGDASHAARPSDHNPDWKALGKLKGVVRARDVDKDGPDMARLLRLLIADVRTNYVIWRGYIYSRIRNFRPVKYDGPNGHFEHIHLSIRKGYEFDTRPWGYYASKPNPPKEDDLPTTGEVATAVWGSTVGRNENKRTLSQVLANAEAAAIAANAGVASLAKAVAGMAAAMQHDEPFDEQKLLDSIVSTVRTATTEAVLDAGAALNALQTDDSKE